MKYRNLRIAWSVAWGVVAVLLCVLWVRSYWQLDSFAGYVIKWNVHASILPGTFLIGAPNYPGRLPWMKTSMPTSSWWAAMERAGAAPQYPRVWGRLRTHGNDMLSIPCWLSVFIVAAMGTLPWLPYRFSLRALLVATTLVAVLLGLIVWALRR